MSEKVELAAIIITFIAPVTFGVIVISGFIFHWPGGMGTGLFYSMAAVPVGVLAIYKVRTGGSITFGMGVLLLTASLLTNHYPQYYVPVGALSILGGTLHLFRKQW